MIHETIADSSVSTMRELSRNLATLRTAQHFKQQENGAGQQEGRGQIGPGAAAEMESAACFATRRNERTRPPPVAAAALARAER